MNKEHIFIDYVYLYKGKIIGYIYTNTRAYTISQHIVNKYKGINSFLKFKNNIENANFQWCQDIIRVNKDVPRIELNNINLQIDYAYDIINNSIDYFNVKDYVERLYDTYNVTIHNIMIYEHFDVSKHIEPLVDLGKTYLKKELLKYITRDNKIRFIEENFSLLLEISNMVIGNYFKDTYTDYYVYIIPVKRNKCTKSMIYIIVVARVKFSKRGI